MSSNGNEEDQKPIARQLVKVSKLCLSGIFTALHAVYTVSYFTGVRTARLARRAGKRLARLLAPVGRFFYRVADRLLLRHLRALAGECKRIAQGFPEAGRRVRAAYRRHPLLSIPQALLLPVLAVKRHRKAAVSLVNLALPVAAAFVLLFTVRYWSGLTFGLVLEYDGQQLGYITDESVYDKAATMAVERVNNTDNSFKVERTPKLTIAVVNQKDKLDETSLCDEIPPLLERFHRPGQRPVYR